VPTKPLRVGGSKQARRVMNRRNRLSRAALVLALLVLAGIVTGVAESATKTAIPKQLTGRWGRLNYGPEDIVVGPRGKVNVRDGINSFHAKFSRVTAHRLSISGIPSCSGTGTYRWTITTDTLGGLRLSLTKIHDACEARVGLFVAFDWARV
jgi:hypothetical protein